MTSTTGTDTGSTVAAAFADTLRRQGLRLIAEGDAIQRAPHPDAAAWTVCELWDRGRALVWAAEDGGADLLAAVWESEQVGDRLAAAAASAYCYADRFGSFRAAAAAEGLAVESDGQDSEAYCECCQ